MFEGYEGRGNARTVLFRDDVMVDGERFLGTAGRGQYLKRAARGQGSDRLQGHPLLNHAQTHPVLCGGRAWAPLPACRPRLVHT